MKSVVLALLLITKMYSLVLVLFIIKNLNIHAYTIIYEYNNYIDTRRFFDYFDF